MSFTKRTTKPSGNKFYITVDKGGYSQCIKGNPTDPKANVLSNCVGYATGRFNEIIGKMKYPKFYTNAENFIEVAKSYGLEISNKPTLGGIMVMQKGSTLKGSDGAGHVFIVEEIYNDNHIYTSESGWGCRAFWNAHRYNTNGRWGMGSGYKFRGCIKNPAVKEEVKKENKPSASSGSYDLTKYTDVQLACMVWQNKFGTGEIRKKSLGTRYKKVQSLVEKSVGKSKDSNITINALAKEVINRKWGDGNERKKRLTDSGFNYNKVRQEVNRLM